VKLSAAPYSPEGVALLSQALNLARRLEDPNTYWWIAGIWLWVAGAPQHDEERLRLAQELAEQPRHGINLLTLFWALFFAIQTFMEFGQRCRAEDIVAEIKELAERSRQPYLLILTMWNDAIRAIWDGRLEEAVEMRRRMLTTAEELGTLDFATFWGTWVLPARVHLGDAGRTLESVLQGTKDIAQNVATDMTILFCLAHIGRYSEVAEMLERLVVARPGIGSTEDETGEWADIMYLEAAVLAGHRRAVELLLCRLSGSSRCTTGMWLSTCTCRHLGAAAALLERLDEARKYYDKAIKDCTEIGFRPELALSRLQLAELLLEHYPDEKQEALEHLDFAIKEFQDMKMQPSLERALRHKRYRPECGH
jgi:tetratricopeptide (TPR) repeat protein